MAERVFGDDWREIFRSDRLDRARAVATTIASMGFDVRCAGSDGLWTSTSEERPGGAPYVVSVQREHFPELREVLDEVIAEQQEFDEMLARQAERGARLERRLMLILLIAAMLVLAVFGLLQV